ncbi:MAG: imidazole glycerol phosphate synthase subunit HisF [Chloroflexi bacterium]|nr:imidazole glycerol phosphate synthase subunit HisF [Chloroflexota bacterium]
MLKIRLIPSLLLADGRCVKGVRFGNYRDVGHPITAAKVYEAQGADELLFLDIHAASEQRSTLLDIIQQTAEQCFMPLTVGGGVKSVGDIQTLLRAGADKISINTAAIADPGLIAAGAAEFGDQCIVVSIDHAADDRGVQRVTTDRGRNITDLDVVDWAKRVADLGAGEILLTSVERDGTREGYDVATVRRVADAVMIPVIAAGGAGSLQDLVDIVTEGHASAVAAASIFHFTDQSPIKAHSFMKQAGLDVRMA